MTTRLTRQWGRICTRRPTPPFRPLKRAYVSLLATAKRTGVERVSLGEKSGGETGREPERERERSARTGRGKRGRAIAPSRCSPPVMSPRPLLPCLRSPPYPAAFAVNVFSLKEAAGVSLSRMRSAARSQLLPSAEHERTRGRGGSRSASGRNMVRSP